MGSSDHENRVGHPISFSGAFRNQSAWTSHFRENTEGCYFFQQKIMSQIDENVLDCGIEKGPRSQNTFFESDFQLFQLFFIGVAKKRGIL